MDGDINLYTVDNGYKFYLEICDDKVYGRHLYYQSDFLSFLKDGIILPAKENAHIEHIKWAEKIYGDAYLIHEADIVVEGNENNR